MPRISAVIPTYNRAASVCQAVDSVLGQTRKADEIVVVDDGSNDDTVERLQAYGDAITLIRQENQGVSAARNAGVDAATGDWIAFLDSDDLWFPNRLAVLERDIAGSQAGVHVGNVLLTGPGYRWNLFEIRGLRHFGKSASVLKHGVDIALSGPYVGAMGVRRDWFAQIGGFEPGMRVFEDQHFYVRLATLGSWLITAEVIAHLRRIEEDHEISLTNQGNRGGLYWNSMRVKSIQALDINAAPLDRRNAVARRLSGALFDLAKAQAASRDAAEAQRTLLESARTNPSVRNWIKILLALTLGRYGYGLAGVFRRKGYWRSAS